MSTLCNYVRFEIVEVSNRPWSSTLLSRGASRREELRLCRQFGYSTWRPHVRLVREASAVPLIIIDFLLLLITLWPIHTTFMDVQEEEK